jgi:hypothetical protein
VSVFSYGRSYSTNDAHRQRSSDIFLRFVEEKGDDDVLGRRVRGRALASPERSARESERLRKET